MSFHDDCLVLDGHTDVPMRLWISPADLSERRTDRHIDLPRLRQGGVDALVWALFIPAALDAERGALHITELYDRAVEHLVPGLELAAGVEDIRAAAGRKAVAVILGLENGRPLAVPGTLERCAKLGVRYVTLTHWATHEWCDASTDEAQHGGLSELGVRLVREMNRLGVVPDVSHVSDDAVRHVLEVSAVPIVASHSSARALCDHPRNLSNELIRDIARKEGVVMANTYPPFVGSKAAAVEKERMKELGPAMKEVEGLYLSAPAEYDRQWTEALRERPLPPVPFSRFVDHVVHLIEQAGEEHVGIGTDFDGISQTLEGFEDVSRFPDLTAALLERGVDRAGVRLILGENFLRVLARAERFAL
jgi:membrane dipeptidase